MRKKQDGRHASATTARGKYAGIRMIRGISTAICRDQVGDMQTFMYQIATIQTLMYIS
jgi:hypothetical protein